MSASMSPSTSATTLPGQAPWQTRLHSATPATKAFAVLIGTLVLAASSQVSVPMQPVPMTMQTLAVTLVGALYGWRLGALTVVAWLVQGALGLPVFAGGASGVARFFGPTGGYLFAFPIAAALTGWLVARSAGRFMVLRHFGAMLAGNALCLVLGGAWLAAIVGANKAWMVGVMPFLLGGALKSVLGAAIMKAHDLGLRR
jgi:biotin transport system substrate-specific component